MDNKKKSIVEYIMLMVVIALSLYFISSFIWMNLDPTYWDIAYRAVIGVAYLVISGILASFKFD